jgi:hypothetical protein
MQKSYSVKKLTHPLAINADWEKKEWQEVESAKVDLPHWPSQSLHLPQTRVKMQYDSENLYLIFRVRDNYVRASAKDIHGEVWKDSCVEFFFTPHSGSDLSYFNLEVNCCGTMLMQYHTAPRQNSRFINVEQCKRIQIASSASGPILKEITKPLTWTVEYRLPLDLLAGYCDYQKPAPGVNWRANFYKCADDTSHPHWIAWSPIETDQPDFHRPDYFGTIKFA